MRPDKSSDRGKESSSADAKSDIKDLSKMQETKENTKAANEIIKRKKGVQEATSVLGQVFSNTKKKPLIVSRQPRYFPIGSV
jgi:hypothetical protein